MTNSEAQLSKVEVETQVLRAMARSEAEKVAAGRALVADFTKTIARATKVAGYDDAVNAIRRLERKGLVVNRTSTKRRAAFWSLTDAGKVEAELRADDDAATVARVEAAWAAARAESQARVDEILSGFVAEVRAFRSVRGKVVDAAWEAELRSGIDAKGFRTYVEAFKVAKAQA